MVIIGKLRESVAGPDAGKLIDQAYVVGVVMAVVAGFAVAGAAFGIASALGSRLTDLSLAVSKMGRGTKAAVRVSGNDEISVLGRALSALSSDIAEQSSGSEEGLAAVDFDPQVRELRDKTLPHDAFEGPDGFEIDAILSAGSRGGNEYFDCHSSDERTVVFLASGEGNSAAVVVAVRMARDELLRALGAGAGARKALSHWSWLVVAGRGWSWLVVAGRGWSRTAA